MVNNLTRRHQSVSVAFGTEGVHPYEGITETTPASRTVDIFAVVELVVVSLLGCVGESVLFTARGARYGDRLAAAEGTDFSRHG